jgi:7-keto-8-aminopelargonate synthetase-like enzyme
VLERFPTLHLYVDDVHGMSIAGRHGQGVHLVARMGFHPRMVLATSLNKAFASAGSCVVFPTVEM